MIDPIRWWHSHNVRLRLTVWYVAAMVVVLAVYAGAIYTFVSRSVSESLDQRLRADFFWAAATVDEGPDGMVISTPQVDLLLEDEPWVQVWSAGGAELLVGNAEARRRPIPGTQAMAEAEQDRTVTFDVAGVPMRVLSRRSFDLYAKNPKVLPSLILPPACRPQSADVPNLRRSMMTFSTKR